MHPGFNVYNPSTLLRLREAVGPVIGANFDPSHLFWQQIDPVTAIRALKGAIHHFHAKDTRIDPSNCALKGVLETSKLDSLGERPWISVQSAMVMARRPGVPFFRIAPGRLQRYHLDRARRRPDDPQGRFGKGHRSLKAHDHFEDDQVNMFWA